MQEGGPQNPDIFLLNTIKLFQSFVRDNQTYFEKEGIIEYAVPRGFPDQEAVEKFADLLMGQSEAILGANKHWRIKVVAEGENRYKLEVVKAY